MTKETDILQFTLATGPDLRIFGQKKHGPRFDIQKMSFEYSHASSDGTFDKKKCRNPRVRLGGENMSPSVFESKVLQRKVGRWETAIKIQEGEGEARIFSKWFEQKVLCGSAKNDTEVAAPIIRLFLGKRPTMEAPQVDEEDLDDASDSEQPASPHVLDTDAAPPTKRPRVTVRVQGLPERFPDYFLGDPRQGLVRDSGRVVAVRAALPTVSYNVLRDFFARHTDEAGLAGFEANESVVSFSAERVRRVRDDPLGRGVIYSFLEDDGRDQAHRRYYLYDSSRAEFIKFCGFDEKGQYVGFKKRRAHQSPDRFSDEEVLKKYLSCANQVKTVFSNSWCAVLEEQGLIPNGENRAHVLDPKALFVDCPFDEDDILRCAREVFIAAIQSQADLNKTLTTRLIIRSLARAVTDEERSRIAEMTKWMLLKTSVLYL